MPGLIEISLGSKSYKGSRYSVTALHEVGLVLKQGEVVVLTGPSGSGKSTLLNIVGGIEQLDSGHITYDFDDGFRGTLLHEALRLKYLGFVFQDFGLLPLLTALENVMFPLQLVGYSRTLRRRMAEEMLDQVGLTSVAHKPITLLSGGERQRVAIARALVNSPRLVLADEPTANLDAANVAIVLELLRKECNRSGSGVLMVSHDARCVSVADRHLELKDGHLENAARALQ
jgi:putative ABC transport system ATP-binding protein